MHLDRPSLQLSADEVGQLAPVTVVDRIDRTLRMRPVRVLLQRLKQSVAVAPEHREAEPLGVVRHVRQQPLRLLPDRFAVAGDWPRPLRRALVDRQRTYAVGDLRHQLHHGGAGADHGHALALDLQALGPVRRVEANALEAAGAVNARQLRIAQLADGADEKARAHDAVAVGPAQLRDPLPGLFVPRRAHQLRREADVLAQAGRVDHPPQIGQNLLAA
jgi:hypothetical protein